MVRREDIPWEELQRLNAQGWSYRRLAEKYGVSSSAIGRQAVLESWHGTNDQRANARLRNLAARLRRQAERRLAEDLDTREIKELTAVLRELMNLQQTLEGQQARRRGPGGAGGGNGGLEPVTEKILTMDRPNPRQQEFLRCRKKYVAFGGARGGGKSWAVRAKAKLLALRYPGIRLLLVRRTYQELEANHIRFLRQELAGLAEYRATARQFVFPNGSVLDFGYCAADGDMDRYQGAEYDVIFLDEATQLKEEWLRQFAACLRGVNEFPKRLYYTCNPGGPGHSYIKRLFIDRRFQEGENPDDYVFIPAKVTDNRALLKKQPDYLRQLEALPRRLRDAWLEGKWDVFQGQVFQEFTNDPAHYQDRRFTHVIAPFDIPREWPVYRSYDFGYAKPFSCGWWAVDYDGVIYRILELYGCTGEPDVGVRWTPEKQFAEIRRIEDTHPWLKGREIQGVADPAIWDTSRGESIYETALRHRVFFTRGDNRRIPGWMQLHYRMSFDEQGYPMLYVFSGCRAFIRTIPELLFDQTDAEDVDTRQEDHVADESRYFCMSRPIPPQKRDTGLPLRDDPLNMRTGT